MSTQRILVLSDLHFGEYSEHRDFKVVQTDENHSGIHKVSMRDEFQRTLAELPKNNLIVAPGDLTSVACPEEFTIAYNFLTDVSEKQSLTDHLYHTFGNHDVHWGIGDIGDSRQDYKTDKYKLIAADIGQKFAPPKNLSNVGPIVGTGFSSRDNYEIVVLNSSRECHRDQTVKSGTLGKDQLDWMRETLTTNERGNKYRIATVHHHPYQLAYQFPIKDYSSISDGDEMLDILGTNGCDLLIHGHRHHPKLQTVFKSHWKNPITIFCAGSFAVKSSHRSGGHLDNTFHTVEINGRHKSGAIYGEIRTYFFSLYGWKESSDHDSENLGLVRGNLPSPTYFGPLSDQTQQAEFVEALLSDAVDETLPHFVELPKRSELPVELKVLTPFELNGLIRARCDAIGYETVSEYPQKLILRKKK